MPQRRICKFDFQVHLVSVTRPDAVPKSCKMKPSTCLFSDTSRPSAPWHPESEKLRPSANASPDASSPDISLVVSFRVSATGFLRADANPNPRSERIKLCVTTVQVISSTVGNRRCVQPDSQSELSSQSVSDLENHWLRHIASDPGLPRSLHSIRRCHTWTKPP